MSAPTLSRVWYSRVNATFPDVTTAALIHKSWLFQLKAHLIDQVSTGTVDVARPGSSVWTVEGSSDGSTAGMDATDRWTNTFNGALLIQATAGSPHSWIVVKSPNAMGPIYMCIDLNSGTTSNAAFIFSRSAFTGGSTTARPTASNEWGAATTTPGTAVAFTADSTLSATHRTHFVVDADGMWFRCTSRDTTTIFNSLMFLINAVELETGDNNPTWVGFAQSTSGRGGGVYTTLQGNTGIQGRTAGGGAVNTAGGAVSYSFGATAFAGTMTADVLTSNFRVLPIYMGTTVASNNAWRGKLPDIWVIGNASVGGSYPTTGSPTQHVVGDVLIPMGVVPTL